MNSFNEKVSFIWSVADLLRGPYRPNQYKDVMLPLTVLRRLDCVLEPTKNEEIAEYMAREVLPHVPDAWVDESKTRVGYEVNFNRYFYKYTPLRPLEEIEADLKGIEADIAGMLEGLV